MKKFALVAMILSVVTWVSVASTRDSYFCDPSDPYSDDCQHL